MTAQFTLSKHAIERALEMGVDGDEIRDAYDNPDEIFWSNKYQMYGYTRGRITLSISEERSCIVTILWASEHAWRADYARGGELGNRERRSSTDMQHLRRR